MRSDGTRSGVNWMRENDPPRTAGGRLDRQRLRQAWNALDQQVALREQADEDPLEHLVLSGDDAADLEQRLLEAVSRLCRLDGWEVVGGRGHGQSSFVAWSEEAKQLLLSIC